MKNISIQYLLRVAVFLTFLGHGLVAVSGNIKWLIYLEKAGFSIEQAKQLIPIIGIIDILVAFTILIRPVKYVVLWAVIWAFSAALIRPISGESILAFVERGSNWIAPLALYFLLLKNKINESNNSVN